MTTGLDIMTDSIPMCLQVPLDAIQTDSISFVFKKTKSGYIKQEVVTGPSNDVNIAIVAGLEPGEEISLNIPEGADKIEFAFLETGVKQKAMDDLATTASERMHVQQERAKKVKADDLTQESQESGSFIIID